MRTTRNSTLRAHTKVNENRVCLLHGPLDQRLSSEFWNIPNVLAMQTAHAVEIRL